MHVIVQFVSVQNELENSWHGNRFQNKTQLYAPCDKDWIKEEIYIMLRKQAGQA